MTREAKETRGHEERNKTAQGRGIRKMDASVIDRLFVRSYMHYKAPLVERLSMLVGSPEAEDIVHETFLYVWQCWRNGNRPRHVRAWLEVVATHRALNRIRKLKRIELRELIDLDKIVACAGDTSEAWVVVSDEVLKQIKPRHCRVLLNRYRRGQSLAECAKSDGVPLGTIKSRLHAAKLELAALLKKIEPFLMLMCLIGE